jgi:N-acetylmuramate 1-kinase
MDPSTLPTSREQQRLAWARAAAGNPSLELERASVDAGFRSYWRTVGNVPSRIVMDSPPEKENVTGWSR